MLQCRPLQTRGLGKTVDIPDVSLAQETCLFATRGNFMGGNVRLPIDYVVFVKTDAYLQLPEQGKYAVARQIGLINALLKGKNAMLIGPGRWGTTTPSLGVPVHYTELSHMTAICEVASMEGGFMPELSYGSHFFQDLVETSSACKLRKVIRGQEPIECFLPLAAINQVVPIWYQVVYRAA